MPFTTFTIKDERELATILASLRLFQRTRGGFERPEWSDHFLDAEPLSNSEIDDLCERVNR